MWDLENGEELFTLPGHIDGIYWIQAVAVTLNENRAVSVSDDRSLKVWNLESEEEVASFTGDSMLFACAVVPDGETIVAGDRLGHVHILRLENIAPGASIVGTGPKISFA